MDQDYFRTIRIPLRAGRGFNEADRDDGTGVIVNEKLARHWWPERPQLAVGHRIKFGGPYLPGRTYEIVGVVGDVSQSGLDVESNSEIYVKGVSTGMVVMIRARASDPAGLVSAARRELESLDRNVPVVSLLPFSSRMAATLDRRRFSTMLLEIFAALAVVLSSVGIYGILNYWMGMRQKEIAIRMALGAGWSHILRWTGRHIVLMAARWHYSRSSWLLGYVAIAQEYGVRYLCEKSVDAGGGLGCGGCDGSTGCRRSNLACYPGGSNSPPA